MSEEAQPKDPAWWKGAEDGEQHPYAELVHPDHVAEYRQERKTFRPDEFWWSWVCTCKQASLKQSSQSDATTDHQRHVAEVLKEEDRQRHPLPVFEPGSIEIALGRSELFGPTAILKVVLNPDGSMKWLKLDKRGEQVMVPGLLAPGVPSD